MKLKPRLVILMMVFLSADLGTVAYSWSEKNRDSNPEGCFFFKRTEGGKC
jgi:hypothetical protein